MNKFDGLEFTKKSELRVKEWLKQPVTMGGRDISWNDFWNEHSVERTIRRVVNDICAYLTLMQRIIRPGAIEGLKAVWSNCAKEKKTFNDCPDDLEEKILQVLKKWSPDKLLEDSFDKDFWEKLLAVGKYIRPNWWVKENGWDASEDEDSRQERNKWKTLENRVKNVLWATPFTTMNPLYEAIRHHYPIVDLLNRLTYLKALFALESDGGEEKDNDDPGFSCILGLRHKLVRLNGSGILLAGGVWLVDKDPLKSYSAGNVVSLGLETLVRDRLNALDKLYKNLKEELLPVSRPKLRQAESDLYMLNMATKFDPVNKSELDRRVRMARRIISLTIMYLIENKEGDDHRSSAWPILPADELRRTLELLLFLYSISEKVEEYKVGDEVSKQLDHHLERIRLKLKPEHVRQEVIRLFQERGELYSPEGDDGTVETHWQLLLSHQPGPDGSGSVQTRRSKIAEKLHDWIAHLFPFSGKKNFSSKPIPMEEVCNRISDLFRAQLSKPISDERPSAWHMIVPLVRQPGDETNTMFAAKIHFTEQDGSRSPSILWENLERVELGLFGAPKGTMKTGLPEECQLMLDAGWREHTEESRLQDTLQAAYDQFRWKFRRGVAHKERIFFNKTRYLLQHIEDADDYNRCRLMVRGAKALTQADYGTFFRYKGIPDTLEPQYIRKAYRLLSPAELDSQDEIDHRKKEAIEDLKQVMEEWATDPEKRRKSSAYRVLDHERVESRFQGSGNGDSGDHDSENWRFATTEWKALDNNLINDTGEWFGEEKDILALPVLMHGRIIGVLHLASTDSRQFTYEDRVRLIAFVQMFEAEIAEARISQSMIGLNKALSLGLTTREDRRFYDGVVEALADLTCANGVSFWLHDGKKHFRRVSHIGGSLSDENGNRPSRDVLDETDLAGLWKGGSGSGRKLYDAENIRELPHDIKPNLIPGIFSTLGLDTTYNAMIFIPIGRKKEVPTGVIVLYDKIHRSLSRPLKQELAFIGGHISQLMNHYLEHKSQIHFIRSLVAHDVAGSLETIRALTNRLDQWEREQGKGLDPERKRKHRLIVGDVREEAVTSKALLNFLRYDRLLEFEKSFAGGQGPENIGRLLIYAHHLGVYEMKRLSVYTLLSDILHSYQQQLKDKKRIKFFLDSTYGKQLKLWIARPTFRGVVGNLLDNVLKYGRPFSEIHVRMQEAPATYQILFVNEGYRLCPEGEADPEILFERGRRCTNESIQQKEKGEGKGLYSARFLAQSWGGDLTLTYEPLNVDWGLFTFCLELPKYLGMEQNPFPRKEGEDAAVDGR